MPTNRSQDYIYFQDKASHYHNILNIKPRIDNSIPQVLRSTIDHTTDIHKSTQHKKPYRHIPLLRQSSIKNDNQAMLRRILAKQKSPLNKHSTYSRYNSFERNFRHRNPQREEQKRLIELENMKMKKAVENVKSNVGSVEGWKKQYQEMNKHSKNMSKFDQQMKPKEKLTIRTERFLPQRYLNYLEKVHNNININNQENSSRSNSRVTKKAVLQKQHLFVLPQLHTSRSPLTVQQNSEIMPKISEFKNDQNQLKLKSKQLI